MRNAKLGRMFSQGVDLHVGSDVPGDPGFCAAVRCLLVRRLDRNNAGCRADPGFTDHRSIRFALFNRGLYANSGHRGGLADSFFGFIIRPKDVFQSTVLVCQCRKIEMTNAVSSVRSNKAR